jgi:hypothetical protein
MLIHKHNKLHLQTDQSNLHLQAKQNKLHLQTEHSKLHLQTEHSKLLLQTEKVIFTNITSYIYKHSKLHLPDLFVNLTYYVCECNLLCLQM